ncbi:hypothetical protein [Streptomyces chartreusis]|uniref:hypothetical protein n=1 Tax=Streptomyces chartreusis TaxID=1969 RepID=UPI002E17F34B
MLGSARLHQLTFADRASAPCRGTAAASARRSITGQPLEEVVQRVRDGGLHPNIGRVATLDDAVAAFNPTERVKGKTIIRVRP